MDIEDFRESSKVFAWAIDAWATNGPKKRSAIGEHPVQEHFERAPVLGAETAEELRVHPVLGGNELWKERLAGDRELEVHRAPILGVRHSPHQALLLQPVDHSGHRAR